MPDVSLNGIQFAITGDTSGASQAIDELKRKLGSLSSSLGNIKGVKKAKSDFNALGASIKFISTPIRQATSGIAGFTKGLKGAFSGMLRIAKYRLFRTVIKEITEGFSEGTKNAYFYTKQIGQTTHYISEAFDEFAACSAQMKNQVGAAWATLFAQIQPIISQLIEWVTKAVEAVTMFFAEISGRNTYLKALKYTTAWAEETEAGADAAKEWKNQLMGFDELNRLNEPSERKGKTGDGTDYSAMFEEVPIETAIAGLADRVKQLWQNQDWQALGTLIGGKINTLLEDIPWATLGTKVGEKINALFTTKYWTVNSVNFQNLGTNIATALNNMLLQIDFNTLGRSMAQSLTAMLQTAVGIVTGTDWHLVGASLGGLVAGWFSELRDKILEIDWTALGQSIASGLVGLFTGVEDSGVADAISGFIGAALGAAISTLIGTISRFAQIFWGTLKQKLTEDRDADDKLEISDILGNMFDLSLGVLPWVSEHILEPLTTALVEVFKPGSSEKQSEYVNFYSWLLSEVFGLPTDAEWKEMAGKIWTKLNTSLKEVRGQQGSDMEAVFDGEQLLFPNLDDGIQAIKDKLSLFVVWFKDNFCRGAIQEGIDIINGFIEGFENNINDLIDVINGFIADVPDWLKDKMGLTEIDHVSLKFIPDLDPPVGTFYEQKKKEIEEKSKKNQVKISAEASITSIKTDDLSDAKRFIDNMKGNVNDLSTEALKQEQLQIKSMTGQVTDVNQTALTKTKKTIKDVQAEITSKTIPDSAKDKLLTIADMVADFVDKNTPNTDKFKTVTGMKASIGSKTFASGFSKTITGMKASIDSKTFTSKFSKTITEMKASISSKTTPTTDTFKTIGGMKAKFGSTDSTGLSAASKTISGVKASITSGVDNIASSNKPSVKAKGNIDTAVSNLVSTPEVTVKGKIGSAVDALTTTPGISVIAKMTQAQDYTTTSPTISAIGNVKSATVAAGVSVNIPATATITSVSEQPIDTTTTQATQWIEDHSGDTSTSNKGRCPTCGATYASSMVGKKCVKCRNKGIDSYIEAYAKGGFPNSGELYWARENGISEMVGRIGTRHAVVNNDQIVASVSAGIARALNGMTLNVSGTPAAPVSGEASNEDTIYRAFKRALDETDFGGDIDLDGEALYKAVVRRNNRNTRMTGVNALAMV